MDTKCFPVVFKLVVLEKYFINRWWFSVVVFLFTHWLVGYFFN